MNIFIYSYRVFVMNIDDFMSITFNIDIVIITDSVDINIQNNLMLQNIKKVYLDL